MTTAEQFFFENNGYLVLEHLLAEEHVARLLATLRRVVAQRREWHERGTAHTGMTHVRGDNTRVCYILDDDPLLLEMVDWSRSLVLSAQPAY